MVRSRRQLLSTLGVGIAGLAGCSAGTVDRSTTAGGGPATDAGSPVPPPAAGPFGFTHLRPDGNRLLAGAGALPGDPVTADLDIEPAGLVGLPADSGSQWVTVATDGSAVGLRLNDGTIDRFQPSPPSLPAGMPPVLAAADPTPRLLRVPSQASSLTHPFPLGNGRYLLVGSDGDILLWDGALVDRLAAAALPDARITEVSESTYAVLGGATDRYRHGALGDDIEAGAMVIVEVGDGLSRQSRISFEGAVVEGLQPIAVPLDAGSESRLLVTLTDQTEGARLAAFGLDGERIATGPSVGTGFRWRHQLCVAPFGPDGGREIAAVKTPHIGGVVEFYDRQGDRLEIVAESGDYASHTFGSRNLDGGLAADLDGDGTVELLVPTQSRDALAALRRTARGIETAWKLPMPSGLTTNVAGLETGGGDLVIAAGSSDGTIRFWT